MKTIYFTANLMQESKVYILWITSFSCMKMEGKVFTRQGEAAAAWVEGRKHEEFRLLFTGGAICAR